MLASLSMLKTRLNIPSDESAEHPRLSQALAEAAQLMEQYCGRKFCWAAGRTETLDGDGCEVALSVFPVASIASVKIALDYDFAAADPLAVNEDYLLIAERGRLVRLPEGLSWPCNKRVVQVVYSGGYADPNADPAPEGAPQPPLHVQYACLVQAVECYRRREQPGHVAGGGAGGASFGSAPPVQLVDEAAALLREERRWA